MNFLFLIPAILLGWSLGSNNSSNIFGPPVSSGLVSYKKAIIISSLFVIVGSIVGGRNGLNTLSNLADLDIFYLSLSLLCAFLTMTIMSFFGLPASATQAVVGALVSVSLLKGSFDTKILIDIFISWIFTPIGALVFSLILYKIFALIFRKFLGVATQDRFIKVLTWLVVCYSSYSLGANNVANVTGVFTNILLTPILLLVIGGLSIAFGILTTNKKVLNTVGKGIIELDHFSSVISILGAAMTLWVYSLIGIPVSAAQAIIGSIIGVGLATGTRTFDTKVIAKVIFGWVGTPLASGIISFLFVYILE
jgi:PiT family inorganic phosphate transporter